MSASVLGLFTGTGSELLDKLVGNETIQVDTPWGSPSGPVQAGQFGGLRLLSLCRHGRPHSIAPHLVNYRANVWAMQEIGAEALLAINAVGGIVPTLPTGSLVLPDQLIDYTWGRAGTFFDGSQQALRHVDFSQPFDAGLREALVAAAAETGETVTNGGTYGVTQGPRLETAAEVSRLSRDGCDIVGMTAMPEAALAAELDLPYALLAIVVNPAAGLGAEPITMADIEASLSASMQRVERLLQVLFGRLGA